MHRVLNHVIKNNECVNKPKKNGKTNLNIKIPQREDPKIPIPKQNMNQESKGTKHNTALLIFQKAAGET